MGLYTEVVVWYLTTSHLGRQDTGLPYLTPADKPALVLDGRYFAPKELPAKISGRAAYIIGAKDPYLERLAQSLEAEYVYFYELRAQDLTAIANVEGLRHLRIHWATKFTNLEWIRPIKQLQTLMLEHTPKVRSLEPLRELKELVAFEFSGGIDTDNVADSLEPLPDLPKLKELRLTAMKVLEGGLRPLARCESLKELDLHYKFETEDYAYLSVALPNVKCDKFQPWVPGVLNSPIGDRLIVGKGKPFLHSDRDQVRIEKYERQWAELKERFKKELGI